jgi:hypothetical protein
MEYFEAVPFQYPQLTYEVGHCTNLHILVTQKNVTAALSPFVHSFLQVSFLWTKSTYIQFTMDKTTKCNSEIPTFCFYAIM